MVSSSPSERVSQQARASHDIVQVDVVPLIADSEAPDSAASDARHAFAEPDGTQPDLLCGNVIGSLHDTVLSCIL